MTRHNPDRHHRRSIRLKGYDYTQAGAYFVTIVTHGRELLFDDPVLQSVAETMWRRIPRHSPGVALDEWVVMPNHIHGIILVVDDPRRGEASGEPSVSRVGIGHGEILSDRGRIPTDASPLLRPAAPPSGSLGAIIGSFKSVTARRINRVRKTPGAPVWQRNYYERVVRNERELDAIRQYIRDNPARWGEDRENPNHFAES